MTGTVIVVGSVNVDLVVRLPTLPRPGETVTEGEFARFPGGKGGNQATAAARLGARVAMIGAVGDDDLGAAALADLEGAGVDVSRIGRVAEAPTGVALITVDRAGENQIAVAPGANRRLRPDDVRDGIAELAAPGAVVLAGLEVPNEAVAAAAAAAERAGLSFVLNPAPARTLPPAVLAAVTVLTPNELEVEGLGPNGIDGLLEAGVGAVVLTRGGEGCEIHRPGGDPVHRPAFPVEVVDTVGAGDAFSGAIAWALAAGRPLDDAVRLAAAAGALATRAEGARGGYATADEVLALAGEGGSAA